MVIVILIMTRKHLGHVAITRKKKLYRETGEDNENLLLTDFCLTHELIHAVEDSKSGEA